MSFQRAYKRKDRKIVRVFRCTSGPRKGRTVADPATCFKPKNYSLANKHRIAANRTKAKRIVKSRLGRKKAIHFRLIRMNQAIDHSN